ncbi:hypothetical protein ACFFGH_17610 [Lysobacter korlensis]|uniref:Uncharacterized protein n=1 Tax=Lysobacter korlensis TaxID=553636 RepID=A0ABV6RUP6_9GAMM
MTYANRSSTRALAATNERTAREVFFAMLAASSLCLALGIVAISRFVA